MDIRSIYGKHPSLTVTRSHSSLSSISLKAQMSSKPQIETPKSLSNLPDVSQIQKSNQDLSQKIINVMHEMKKLKTVSKDLKKKEEDLKSLQDTLLKSNEDLLDTRIKQERSQKLISEILKQVKSGEDERLFELYPIVCKHIVRLKQKRNSLIIDDLVFSQNPVHSVHTARDFKVKSPYFSGVSVLSSPRVKKLKFLKCQTNKSTPKLDNRAETAGKEEKIDLPALMERIKLLVKYIKKG